MSPTKKPGTAKKPTAKRAAAKKSGTAKKSAAKKPAAKRAARSSTAGKAAPAKKASTRKGAARKSTAKQAPEDSAAARTAAATEATSSERKSGSSDHRQHDDLWGDGWDDLDSGTATFDTSDDGSRHGPHDRSHRTAEGVELFQNAALELIGAARNALDAAEELVADPHAIGTAVESLRGIAAEVLRAATPVARHGGERDADPDGEDDDDDFHHIRIVDG